MKNKKRTVILKVNATEKASEFETKKSKVERENIEKEEIDNSQGSYDGSQLEKNVRLMSPARMVIRRFFRSKLSIVGLVMIVGLFIFSFIGPFIYHLIVPAKDIMGSGYTTESSSYFDTWWKSRGWQQDEKDESGKTSYIESEYRIATNQYVLITYKSGKTEKFTYKILPEQKADKSIEYRPVLFDEAGNKQERTVYGMTLDANGKITAITLNKKRYDNSNNTKKEIVEESISSIGNAITTEYVTKDGIKISEYKYEYVVKQILDENKKDVNLAPISKIHPLGTDNDGYDVLSRLMYGGRTSLIVSFLAVFIITGIGIIAGGIAGYFGGVIDNIIMRICDILMCLPGIPILLIVGIFLREMISDGLYAAVLNPDTKIYFMMAFIALISWPGTARLVRGQILSLREQEYMVAAEAMGYSTFRKIFKHLIPNVMPQLIVQMTLSLGGMIIYESSLSYLGFGVQEPNTAWGSILKILEGNNFSLAMNHPWIWVPAGLCIVIAVLGFNFVGDGLRDALDPKARR